MRKRINRLTLGLGAGLLALALAVRLATAGGGGFRIVAWSDHAGGSAAGGAFRASGSAGQPAADRLSGGPFVVHSGFWVQEERLFQVYLPVTLN